MKKHLLLSAAFILTGFLAPLMLQAQKEETKTFTGIKSIRMNTSSGSYKIQKGSDATVTVLLRTTYSERVDHSMEQDGDRLTIRETFHDNNVRGEAYWTLTVPDGMNIGFKTGSGSIEIANMKIDLNVTTGSGDLLFKGVTGSVVANTGSGDLELQDFNGELNVNIGSGNARVENCQGSIKVNTGSGTIRLSDSKATFKMNTGSGNVISRNITLNGSSQFNSGSGDAEVILATTPQFDISVNSGSGDAELNFNGHEIVGEVVMKASKENGKITAPFEFDKVEETNEWGNNNTTVKKTVVKGNASHKIQVSTGSGEAILKK